MALKFGTEVYEFDPEDAWEPDFPRCAVCEEELRRGDRVVDAGRYREAHAECARERKP